MALRRASDVFVECLEAEGVKHVFGIPGEETLDLNESLADSSIEFVPVRHEQGAAYMADVWGRLTGRAGVCLGTLGPGAMNLVTAVADAYLDRAPLVALREFARATGIPVAETFMGKGAMDPDDPHSLGAVGLQSGDYKMAGFEVADLVIAIGYDLVEHSPDHWNRGRDKTIVCIDSLPAEIDDHFIPEVELVGDIYHILSRLGEECRHVPHSGGADQLREVAPSYFDASKDDVHFPMQPPRALWEIRRQLGREDILVSDVGLHKLWIGRMFPAYE